MRSRRKQISFKQHCQIVNFLIAQSMNENGRFIIYRHYCV